MLIRWKQDAKTAERVRVRRALEAAGARFAELDGVTVVQSGAGPWIETFAQLAGVAAVEKLDTPYKLVARAVRPRGSVVRVGAVEIGGGELVVAAGPCSVEDAAQMEQAATSVARSGARLLRAGAFKPRTSPYEFRGLGARGLELLEDAGLAAGLPTVTEVMSVEDLPLVAARADLLQVGARNAQNFALLEALGRVQRPVLLKRGPSMTLEELLLSAEYIVAHGNPNVILCERGVRTFDKATRNMLDLGGVAALKRATHLPVMVDPSHACGRRDLVEALALAAVSVGADGLLVEVHPRPDESWSDAAQALSLEAFDAMMRKLAALVPVSGRTLARPSASSTGEAIAACRGRIDAIDDALVALLEHRLALAGDVGRAKATNGAPAYAPEREAEIRARIEARAAGSRDPGALLRMFEAIVRETRASEERTFESVDAAAE